MNPGHVFEENGVKFMVVYPTKSLFHSAMIHDVIRRGDLFVVNLSNGDLTIRSAKKKFESAVSFYLELMVNKTLVAYGFCNDELLQPQKYFEVVDKIKKATSGYFRAVEAGSTRICVHFNPKEKVPEQFIFEIFKAMKAYGIANEQKAT
jgi:hypothetical protein